MQDRLLSALFVLLWTSGYVIGALAIEVSGALPLLAMRFCLASLVTVPLALRGGHLRGAPFGRMALVGVLLQIVQFGGIYGGFGLGVSPGVSALLMLGLSPLVSTGLAVATGQERSSTRRWAGLVLGAVGVAVGLLPDLSAAKIGTGLVLTAIGMLGLAGGTVLQKHHNEPVDPRAAMAVQSVTAMVLVGPVALIVGGRVDPGAQLWLTLAWLGMGMGVFTLSVLLRLIARTSASHVGALLLLVPAVTAFASAPVLGEPIHWLTLAGMAIAAVGVSAALTEHNPLTRLLRPAHTS